MTTKIKNIKVSDFEEETITKVISQLKMVSTRLEVIDKIPENTEKNVIGIIQTSSVPDFNNYFNWLGLSLKQVLSFNMTHDALLMSLNR